MKYVVFMAAFLLATIGVAATPQGVTSPEELSWNSSADTSDTTAKVEKSLEEIVEEENWKLKKPFTGSDWNWNFNWKEEEGKTGRKGRKSGYFRGGAGGFEYFYLPLEMDELNATLANTNISPLPKKMFLTGGGGWGFIGHGIRIGGLGAGGDCEVDGLVNGLQRELKLDVGFGGVIIEKVFHPFNRSELSLGVMLGGGSASIELKQWHGPVSWADLTSGYEVASDTAKHSYYDYSNKVSTDFFTALPSIGFRYNIFRWFAVGANVGYLYTMMDDAKWKMDGKRITGMPKIDFSNVLYRVNFYFGG